MNWRQYIIAIKKFYIDNGPLHASALTFYTIFAIVPVFATAFGIAKGFGLENFLNLQLERSFPGQETTVQTLSEYAQNLLAQSSGGLIAGVALLVLFYSVYSMLSRIETSLNDIWQVAEPRKISIRVSYYLSLILIAPIILVVAGSLKIFISDHIYTYSPLLSWTSSTLSLLLVIFLFYWLYKYMPNIKVNSKSALIGATHAGVAYILCQSALIESQLIMSNYSAVYGGFAALPIFLIWVQISWIIVLLGAQLCFVQQNNIQNEREISIDLVSINDRYDLLLKVANSCIAKFNISKPAPSINDLAEELQLPPSLVRQLVSKLLYAKILAKTINPLAEYHGYIPATNPVLLNESHILDCINRS